MYIFTQVRQIAGTFEASPGATLINYIVIVDPCCRAVSFGKEPRSLRVRSEM